MISDPVSSGQPQAPADRPNDAWTAQDFALQGERALTWFEALRAAEHAFIWAALFARKDGQVSTVAQTERDDSRAHNLAVLAETAAAQDRLKLSVLQAGGANLTAMAIPLAGTDFICVAIVARKLVEATRLSNLFEVSADKLSQLLSALPTPAQTSAESSSPFSDADLLDLFLIDNDEDGAEALFSRLSAALEPDQALLARVERGRVGVLRATSAADPLPAGSRGGQARLAALHAAAGADQLLLRSDAATGGGSELADVAREESLAFAMTLSLPARERGRLVWLASWDGSAPELEQRLAKLRPRFKRLDRLLEAARPSKRAALFDALPLWLDPRGWRLWTALVAVVIAVWLLMPAPLHVVGQASLRSTAQRSLVAPRDGFLASVSVQPGDTVRAGEILAEFDTRELVLRQSRIEAQIAQARSRRMGAMAEFNTAMVQVADAEIEAMSAERDLIALLLAQSRLIAEEDAVVVSGDMAERVGTAMRHGEAMFDLAPLEGFMVAIDIPQRDVIEIAPGQSGQLKLTALPFDTFPIELERVSLSSDGQEGGPAFVGFARLDAEHEAFRSGMQGTAQIEVDQSVRAWVLLRDFVFWAQMQWWRWVP